MKISARNILRGKVINLKHGSVNSEVVLKLAEGVELVSIITKESAEKLELIKGTNACAVIKASNIMIAVE